MPQIPKHPLKSKIYSKILLEIGLEEINFSEIKNRINKNISQKKQKKKSVISEQLVYLKRKRYIKTKIPEKRKTNEKNYYINWRKIATEYTRYITKTTGKKFDSISKSMGGNPYLVLILKLAVEDYLKIPNKKRKLATFYDIFEKITMQIVYHIPLHKWENLTELAEDRHQLKNLLVFTKEVEEAVAVDFEETIENFYDYLINNNINFD